MLNMQHTTTQPRITTITQTHQSVFKKSIFVIGLTGLGGIAILAGTHKSGLSNDLNIEFIHARPLQHHVGRRSS